MSSSSEDSDQSSEYEDQDSSSEDENVCEQAIRIY